MLLVFLTLIGYVCQRTDYVQRLTVFPLLYYGLII